MGVRRLGHWLAIAAIALHAAWPLIANARPKSVHLVPLCTVEGVTHYIELPGGKSPLDESASTHREHCSFCFLGTVGVLPSHVEAPVAAASASERIARGVEYSHAGAIPIVHGARAPPLSPVVTANHNIGRQSETDLLAGRAARAPYG
jgi:hypothetical protein